MRFRIILAVAALALAGCNANQKVDSSAGVFARPYVSANPYNPISYAQNNTGRGAGGH